MRKNRLTALIVGLMVFAISLSVCLTGCDSGGIGTVTDLTYTHSSRAYSFNTAKGATEYQLVVEKILNETTGKALTEGQTITREEKGITITQPCDSAANYITKPGASEAEYVWKTNSSVALNVRDNDGDGKVSGTLDYYQFQSKADGVTPTFLDGVTDDIPMGHYYLSCYGLDDEGNQGECAWLEFVVGGTLDAPNFAFTVDNGKMTITLNSSYVESALTTEGLPERVEFEIDDGSGTNKKATIDNFGYYTSVVGPQTSFNFMFLTTTIDVASSTTGYTVTAKAIGDGDKIKDSEAKVIKRVSPVTSIVPQDYLGSSVEFSGTTAEGMSVKLKIDETNNKFTIEGTENNLTYGSAYGTFTVSEEVYTFTFVGGGDWASSVQNFTVSERDGGTIKTGTAEISCKDCNGDSVTVNVKKEAQNNPGESR